MTSSQQGLGKRPSLKCVSTPLYALGAFLLYLPLPPMAWGCGSEVKEAVIKKCGMSKVKFDVEIILNQTTRSPFLIDVVPMNGEGLGYKNCVVQFLRGLKLDSNSSACKISL